MSEANPKADWERVEVQYRIGAMTLREIAAEHGITEGAVRKRAKRDGWVRDLTERVRAKAQDRTVALADELDRSGYVYVIFIDTGLEKLYKIGMAVSFGARFDQHQCSSPFEIRIACAYFVGNMRYEERGLHEYFGEQRVRGEWFRLSHDDLTYIATRSLLVPA